MIDLTTITQLAQLRAQIGATQQTCGATLDAMASSRRPALAITTPFLADCADELEALAGKCRKAAAEAGKPATLD